MSTLGVDHDPRVSEMHDLYAQGATLAQVGDRYGLSRERIRQLFAATGLPTRTLAETAEMNRRKARERGTEVVAAYRKLEDIRAVAEQLGVPQSIVREIVREERARQPTRESARRRKPSRRRFSDQELLDALRAAHAELGGVLSVGMYGTWARGRVLPDGRPWPGHQVCAHRFGSWRAALMAAGLNANGASPITGTGLFAAPDCVDAVRHVSRKLGRVPTCDEYDREARRSAGALPSLATIRTRCGGWLAALTEAGL